jgi:hypothetical protein
MSICAVCLLAGYAHGQQLHSLLTGFTAMLTSLKMLQSDNSNALCYTAGVCLLAALFKTLKQGMTASVQDLLQSVQACSRWHTAPGAEHI